MSSKHIVAAVAVLVTAAPLPAQGTRLLRHPAVSKDLVAFDVAAVDSPTTLITLIDRDHPGQSVSVGWSDQFGQSQRATITLGTGPAG